MTNDRGIESARKLLRITFGVVPFLAGLDKFFNLLANWSSYVSPTAAQLLPVSVGTFMDVVGIIELAVGVAILTGWTRLGAYVASAWLLGVAANLVLAGFFDVAVRDVVMAIAAFTLARLSEVRQEVPAYAINGSAERGGHRLTV